MTAVAVVRRAAGCLRRLTICFAREFPLTIELAGWRLLLPLLKRAVALNTLTRIMWSERGARAAGDRRESELQRMNWIIATGGRILISSNCLERSLVLYRLFSRAGAEPRLVLGTAAEGRPVEGHVWVELDGEPVGEPNRHRYTSVVSFTRRGRVHRSSGLGAHV
jgi:hypothetical protein